MIDETQKETLEALTKLAESITDSSIPKPIEDKHIWLSFAIAKAHQYGTDSEQCASFADNLLKIYKERYNGRS